MSPNVKGVSLLSPSLANPSRRKDVPPTRPKRMQTNFRPGPMERFCLYETRVSFKIDKNLDDDGKLVITEDATTYTASQLRALLEQLTLGNAASGGLTRPIDTFWGIVGFIKFTGPYYLVTIKTRVPIAMIGGHYIYHSEETQLTPVTGKVAKNQQVEEARLMAAFKSVDLSKNFYLGIRNLIRSPVIHIYIYIFSKLITLPPGEDRRKVAWGYHDKFFGTITLLFAAFGESIDRVGGSPWVLPLIYGFVDQSKLNVLGRTVYVAVIARRSRHFAGARFLKRGVSEDGYVANEVEIEQIVTDAVTTALHIPDPSCRENFDARKPNPRYTSYVQLRGSIPLLWNQDATITKAKPPIEFSTIDPYFSGAALHFDDLFCRYGAPITVLNLIKEKERQPRECRLLPEFKQCVEYLNQFLPSPDLLEYNGFDMSAAQRSRQVDVISYLTGVAEEVIHKTKFFHSGPEPRYRLFETDEIVFNDDGEPDESEETQKIVFRPAPSLQFGLCRTNCIDCIDRTNAAQFVVGKAALAHQLHALGIIKCKVTPYDSDAVDILTNMYHDLGDTIALQYGGSHLVNTLQTYRKTGNQYKSHARDTLEGLKRFYANSFADADKQASIDLYLGITGPASLAARAEMSSNSLSLTAAKKSLAASSVGSIASTRPSSTLDQIVETEAFTPEVRVVKPKRSYINWFHPEHLVRPPSDPETLQRLLDEVIRTRGNDDYYIRYYRPWLWTSTENHLGRKMNSSDMFTPKGIAYLSERALEVNLSPFKRRRGANEIAERMPRHSAERTPHGVGVSVGVRRWLKTKSSLTLKSGVSLGSSKVAGDHEKSMLRFRALQMGGNSGSNNYDFSNQFVLNRNNFGVNFHKNLNGLRGFPRKEVCEIERIATRLTNPVVDRDEEKEYHSYLHQFDQLRLCSTSTKDEIYEGDLRIYEKSSAISNFQLESSQRALNNRILFVNGKNRKIYLDSVLVSSNPTI
ncbi:SacI homology domain-containing protein [Phakopsora pachyrhizi]|nr:SacI homology domain-containing protein [Phakopsora pachyrhizi]